MTTKMKWIRESRGLSLTQVVTSLGITKSYLSKMENLHRKPTVKILRDLASLYGVDAIDLVGDFSMGNEMDA